MSCSERKNENINYKLRSENATLGKRGDFYVHAHKQDQRAGDCYDFLFVGIL